MKEKLLHFYRGHRSGVWGAGIGLLAGGCMLALGFWRTMFLVLCALIGFVFGKIYVSDTRAGEIMRRIFRRQMEDDR